MRVFYKGRDNKEDIVVYFSKYETAVRFLENHKDNYEYFKILNKNDKVNWKNLKGMKVISKDSHSKHYIEPYEMSEHYYEMEYVNDILGDDEI